MHMVVCFELIFTIIVLLLGTHGSFAQTADIINRCINSTNSTSCIHTYEQVHQSLASKPQNNYFNIAYALYPGRSKPSSVRVYVNVYGLSNTKDSTPAQYTWSLSCLYSAVPSRVLELLSLGSILVTHRTQELNLHIPLFCCNVSDNKEEREEKIKGYITRVLGELQDLAENPGIHNPSLNTAKCIIEGHKPDIEAAGTSFRVLFGCSLFFVIVSSPLLCKYVMEMTNDAWPENGNGSLKKKNIMKALYILCIVLSVLGFVVLTCALFFSFYDNAYWGIPAILITIIVYSFILSGIGYYIVDVKSNCLSCAVLSFVASCANLASYYFCWLLIGIMINPTWGLTVALLVCTVTASFMYAVYCFLQQNHESDADNVPQQGDTSKIVQTLFFCAAGFVAVVLLVVIIIFAGQSYNSNETADEVLKIILLYFIGAFVSWFSWKKQPVGAVNPATNQEMRPLVDGPQQE